MKSETPDEKWNRLQNNVQDGILKAYPNPDRKGCPGRDGGWRPACRARRQNEPGGSESASESASESSAPGHAGPPS